MALTDACVEIVTSPITVAFGAIKASTAINGFYDKKLY